LYEDLTAARVLADSIASDTRHRITTVEITFPRFILAEFNTHKSLARNSASSRAIPVAKQIEQVREHPFVPQRFPVNRPGMSAVEYVGPEDDPVGYDMRVAPWMQARDAAIRSCSLLSRHGVHKQIANRLLEPFMWHTVIATATWDEWDWPNVFELRISEHAQPEIRTAIEAVRDACAASTPARIGYGDYHLPLIEPDDDRQLAELIKSSAARCAAVSYNRHLDQDPGKEYDRYEQLASMRHLSPFEHVAHSHPGRNGPFTGWRNLRWYVERGLDPLQVGSFASRDQH
jgi:hypothetical protein